MQRRMRGMRAVMGTVMVALWLVGCSGGTSRATTPVPVPSPLAWARVNPAAVDALAWRTINAMTLDQKIGQLIVQGFNTVGYDDEHKQIIQQIQPGGTMWYQYNMPTLPIARDTIARVQADSPIPLLTMSDYEPASNADTFQGMFPLRYTADQISTRNDPAFAYTVGKGIAADMQAVGMNVDWAPEVDVPTVAGPDTAGRNFGADPQKVATLSMQFVAGLQAGGVGVTLKHFPGLGAATVDAHAVLPIINKSRQELEQWDLVPYKALINGPHSPEMIMGTDVLYPQIDATLPTGISPIFMTDILRNELHYDGVVVTDALTMGGITKPTPPYYKGVDTNTAAVMSIQAGCDLLDTQSFALWQAQALVARFKQALNNGELTLARIEQSDLRILRLKIRMGLLPLHPVPPAPAPQSFGVEAVHASARPAALPEKRAPHL